jgi:DNA-binding transcriptional LysR family regulator
MIEEISGDLLQWLRGFYYVARKGSVTQATTLMGRRQSTITRQIKCLEKELGVALFDRFSGKMKLTPEGRLLYEKAITLFDDVRELKNEFGKGQLEYQGKIVVATSHAIIDAFLPPYVAKFMNTHPHVSFHMLGGVFETAVEEIESGQADFGIAFLDSAPKTMACYDLFETGQTLIAPKNSRFFNDEPPNLRQIADAPLIIFSRTGAVEPFIKKSFAAANLTPNIIMTHNNFVSTKKYVRMGLGVALLSDYAVSTEDKETMDIFPLDRYFPKRRMGILLRKRKYIPPAARAFIRTIKPEINFDSENAQA